MKFSKVVRVVKSDWFLILLLFVIFSPLYFYKLGQSSLVSFDEAWYAHIARNMLRKGNIFELWWNGDRFYDHPPTGFWFTALIYKYWGINNLSARMSQAIAGILGVLFTYLLGKELYGRRVGVLSAIALSSPSWYLFRARSGNLDILLTFLFVLTLYFAVKTNRDKRYIYPFAVSFAFLTLSKTLVPLMIIPVIMIALWKPKNISKIDILYATLVYALPVGLWFYISASGDRSYFVESYLGIGLPGVGLKTDYIANINQMKSYLHFGIGRWFWPGVMGVIGGFLTLKRKYLLISIFCIMFFLPFVLSSKGHIWHLIPLYPFMIVSFFSFSFFVLDRLKIPATLGFIFILMFSLYVSVQQIMRSWHEFINIPAFISDEEILSKESRNYPGELYIDGDFVPSAVFYSDNKVNQIQLKTEGTVRGLFNDLKEFTFITYQNTLDGAGILDDEYEIIKKDRDKILLRHVLDQKI